MRWHRFPPIEAGVGNISSKAERTGGLISDKENLE